MLLYQSDRKLRQALMIDDVRQERVSPADTMWANAGRRLYVIGDIDGRFRPRSNPYDLYAFGKPQPDDPLANRLQGVWAQPVKGFNSYAYAIEGPGGRWELADAESFTQRITCGEFGFHHEGLVASRVDFVPMDLPVLFTTLKVENTSGKAFEGTLVFTAEFDLQDAWFTSLADRRNQGQAIEVIENRLVARAEVRPEAWAAAVQSDRAPDAVHRLDANAAQMRFHLSLRPGESQEFTFGLSVVSEGGAAAALQILANSLPRSAALLAEKQAEYKRRLENAPRLVSPDGELNVAFRLAVANMQMLEADTDGLGRYFFAGLEMFPFWFGGDGAYSLPGLLIAGFRRPAFNHALIGQSHQEAGRVPHQISPNGRTLFAGNAQETSCWVASIWQAYLWTGDRAFLEQIYPGAVKGLFEFTLGAIDPDQDGYPSGPGAVEREDMGEEKLDSAAHAWNACKALANMADVFGDTAVARKARRYAARIERHFDADWWDASGGTYAMSLTAENRRYPVPHWAVVVPLEVGIASPRHAATTLATLRAQYLNNWGLKHTVGADERVWTLPTYALSHAAYRYGEPELGFAMLRHIADTLRQGPIGMLHELIPEGACFLQLWSACLLVQGVVEDLLGIQVRADREEIAAHPRLPESWVSARIENLRVGQRLYRVDAKKDGTAEIKPVA